MIYLDHHGTTPLHPSARAAVLRALALPPGNPSSVHAGGRAARALLEQSRAALAAAVGAAPRELVFTSGGTEALHLAVRASGEGADVRAVLCDAGAHPALRAACEALGRARDVRVLTAQSADPAQLAAQLAGLPAPALVAIALVQHETGAVAPWRALARVCRDVGALCVGDAVQALGKVPLDLPASGLCAAALSAHKIGGPPGIGAAWLIPGAALAAVQTGGGQERGLRAGTENVPGIAGFGAAALALPERLAAMAAVSARRDRIERALLDERGVVSNGAEGPRVATACHVSVRGAAGEELVAALDLAGFCVSSGPACASGRAGPSPSLRALYPAEPWRAASALRITLGPETRDEEVDALLAAIPALFARVRGGAGS